MSGPILASVASAGKTVQQFTHLSGTKASSGNNEVVAAPGAGNRLVVKNIIVQNESTTETTIKLKSASAEHWRAELVGGDSLALHFAQGDEWRLGENEALNLDLGGANSHGYSLRYFTEPV